MILLFTSSSNMFDYFLDINNLLLKFAFAQKEVIDSYLLSIYQLNDKTHNIRIDQVLLKITNTTIELNDESSFEYYIRKYKKVKIKY